MSKPQNAAPILGDLDRHALTDPAKPIELVVRELPKIPNRRFRHVPSLLLIRADRITQAGRRQERRLTMGRSLLSSAQWRRP